MHALARHVELDVVVVEAGVGCERLVQPLHELGIARERLVERDADEVLAPVGEQRLRGGVRMGHMKTLVEH